MVVVSSTIAVGPIGQALSAEGEPVGDGGEALERAFPRFVDDLMWWAEAAKARDSQASLREPNAQRESISADRLAILDPGAQKPD